MKNKGILACLLFILILAFVLGYYWGRRNALIQQFKVYENNLIVSDRMSFGDDLDSFLRLRYYYLAEKMPPWVTVYDHGIVTNETVLKLSIGKGVLNPNDVYIQLKDRMTPAAN